MIQKLSDSFDGKGEVKGFAFLKALENDGGYVYCVTNEGRAHYEVFKKKTTPVCIDFEKKVYSQADTKEVYPKSNDFGVWAWSVPTLERAIAIFNSLNRPRA